jgi:hypothetical protein
VGSERSRPETSLGKVYGREDLSRSIPWGRVWGRGPPVFFTDVSKDSCETGGIRKVPENLCLRL